MPPKGVWIVGAKMYAVCSDCEQIVCINKRLVGSWHLCLTDEERAVKQSAQQQQINQQRNYRNSPFYATSFKN